MTHAILYQILIEAEARVEQYKESHPDVAARSAETVALVKERMAREGLTRDALRGLAGVKP